MSDQEHRWIPSADVDLLGRLRGLEAEVSRLRRELAEWREVVADAVAYGLRHDGRCPVAPLLRKLGVRV